VRSTLFAAWLLAVCAACGGGGSDGSASAGSASNPPASDTTAPSVPAGVAATAVSASQINLSWSASTDNVAVASYRVLRNGTLLGSTGALTYADTGLTAATRYTYTVAALDAAGNASAQSAPASATTQSAGASGGAPLGTNLTAVRDWSQEWAFVDAFHASRPWLSGAGLNGNPSRGGSGINMFADPNAICAQFRRPILGLDTTDGGAGVIRGFPTWNLDATVTKDIRIKERIGATLMFQFSNLLNHFQPANPTMNIDSPAAWGVVTNQATSANGLQARQMEFGLRIRF